MKYCRRALGSILTYQSVKVKIGKLFVERGMRGFRTQWFQPEGSLNKEEEVTLTFGEFQDFYQERAGLLRNIMVCTTI